MTLVKPYYYLLFRIYRFYVDRMKEKDIPLIYVSALSTVLIFFNILTFLPALKILSIDINYYLSNKIYVLTSLVILWIANYIFFVKPKKFLEFNFKKDKKGGKFILIYIIFTTFLFIFVANYYRANLF